VGSHRRGQVVRRRRRHPPLTVDQPNAALQRRTLRVLTAGQVVGSAAIGSSATVGAYIIQDLLGSATAWAGLGSATVTIGSATFAHVLARHMGRRGRRPGLAIGYGAATIGAGLTSVGAQIESLPVVLVGMFLFGAGVASNLLTRFAAVDLAMPEDRGRSMSRIVFASTFGAVFGPLLVAPAERAGQSWFGLTRYSGPWLLSMVWFAFAFANSLIRLRPDPLVVAGGAGGSGPLDAPIRLRAALSTIAASPLARLGLAAMVVSQVVMTSVMTMTPVHLKLHGHEGISAYIVSLHIAGMYALSPLVGRYSDRAGRRRTIVAGATVLIAANVIGAASGDVELLLFPSLWALGLGWSFGLIGGSALLTESVPSHSRVVVQGSADLLMSLCGGLAGLASGYIRKMAGYHVLAELAVGASLALFAAALFAARPTRVLQPASVVSIAEVSTE
jgi:MFS family permease